MIIINIIHNKRFCRSTRIESTVSLYSLTQSFNTNINACVRIYKHDKMWLQLNTYIIIPSCTEGTR